MAITFLYAGTAETFDTKGWNAYGGAESSESTIVHTGPRSLKLANYGSVAKNGVCQDAGSRITFYVYFDVIPGAGSMTFAEVFSAAQGVQIELRLVSTGILRLRDGSGTLHDGTTVLSPATWYRISLAYTITSTTVNEFRLFLNGVSEISRTNVNTNVAGAGPVQWILEQTHVPGTINYFSDLYIDDSNALTDPGDIRVTVKLPTANSTNAWNTAIGTNPSNRWENVNERPLSETNGWEETALSAVEESYGIQAAADTTGGSSDVSAATIIGHGAWVWAKGGAGGLGSPQLIRNGTDVSVTLTASPAYYSAYAVSATYPSGVIGMKSAGVTDTTFLYETGMLIAYTPAAGGPPPAGSGVAGSSGVYSPRAITQPVASGWA